jgi:hypothetical protein
MTYTKACLTWMADIKASLKARFVWMAQPMAHLTAMARLTSRAQQMATLKALPARILVAVGGGAGLVVAIGSNGRDKNPETGEQPPGQN